jgi:hypothetical protein
MTKMETTATTTNTTKTTIEKTTTMTATKMGLRVLEGCNVMQPQTQNMVGCVCVCVLGEVLLLN